MPSAAVKVLSRAAACKRKLLSPTQKLNPVPKKGVEMRVPTTIEISLPDTVGPSSGDEAVTCSGPGRFCTGVPAQGMLVLTLHHSLWLTRQTQSTPLRARAHRRGADVKHHTS